MQKFGLIGFPLSHSFSAKIHNFIYKQNKIKAGYELIEISNERFGEHIFKQDNLKNYDGYNITIPYKSQIIPFLDEVSDEVKHIGAVNTVTKIENQWYGFNTDVFGFIYPLREKKQSIKNCLILGTGGAARAVIYALIKYFAPQNITLLGRNESKLKQLKQSFDTNLIETDHFEHIGNYLSKSDLIVNTTPVGMYPNLDQSIIPESFSLKPNTIVYDLIYNPPETKLLEMVNNKYPDCQTINGTEMLIVQAIKSIEIWTGINIPIQNTIDALNKSKILL